MTSHYLSAYSGYTKTVVIDYYDYQEDWLVSRRHILNNYDMVEKYIAIGNRMYIKKLGSLSIINIHSMPCHDTKNLSIVIVCSIF